MKTIKNEQEHEGIKTNVQWFPGHMAKTRRQIKESLPLVDAVTELLDARVPLSSQNPELAELIGTKPRIILLNKCDLADAQMTARWVRHFTAMGCYALPVDCRSGKGLQQYHSVVRDALREKIARNEAKGMPGKALRVMVVGIPNTGKSSFINRMAGKAKAKVADRPGVTRQNQWFPIGNGIELLDTPGILWPKFEDPTVGEKLGFIGSVKDEVMDMEFMAMRLLEIMRRDYADRLRERYGIDVPPEIPAYELLELIGKKRGMMMSGGVVNTERTANMLLDEYKSGKLGRITLDPIGEAE